MRHLKRYAILFSAAIMVMSTIEGCLMHKNRCDSCPSHAKQKRVRHVNKGSR